MALIMSILLSLVLFLTRCNGGGYPYVPPPTTASPTTASPTEPVDDREKCECYDITLKEQTEYGSKICFTYDIDHLCDGDYYQEDIDYVAFHVDADLEECCDDYGYTLGGYPDCEIVDERKSECKTIDQQFSNKVDGIKCEFGGRRYLQSRYELSVY